MNRGEGFKAMNAKDIVLPKRDLDYKVKLVSNDDWLKKVRIFLVLSSLPFFLGSSLQSVFWSSSYFLPTLLFAGYLPFYLCLFLFSFAFLSPYSAYLSVLSYFFARFSRLALRLLLLAFFGRSVAFFPAYFHSKPYFYELEL